MNQRDLYATLNRAGCKIISFEDYPSNQGSWRISFLKAGYNCEVICNRFDGLLMMEARNVIEGKTKSSVNSSELLTDASELAYVSTWIISLSNKPEPYKNRIESNTSELLL